MNGYSASYHELTSRLRAVRRRETSLYFLKGGLSALAVTLLLVTAATLVEMVAHGDITFRTVLVGIVITGALSSAAFYLTPAIARVFGKNPELSEEYLAIRVGDAYPEIKDKLSNALQLVKNLDKPWGHSKDLSLMAFTLAADSSRDKNFNRIIQTKEIKKSAIFFLISAAITAAAFLSFPESMANSFNRVAHYYNSYIPPAPFSLEIEPIEANIVRNSPLVITVKADGTPPDEVSLYIKEEQQENYDIFTLKEDSSGYYSYQISSLKKAVRFYAESNWLNESVTTREEFVSVTNLPLVKSLSGRLIYPHYTGRGAKEITEQAADVSGLVGSKVELTAITNKNLEKAEIVIIKNVNPDMQTDSADTKQDTVFVPMEIDGRKASGEFRIRFSGLYYISVTDTEGQKNIGPIKYSITAMYDDYPSISMLQPTMDVQIGEDGLLYMKAAISDDYGFSSLKLRYRLAESEFTSPEEKFSTVDVPVMYDELAMEVPYLWNLNALNISPSDKFEYYFEVFDNDRVSGPKSAKTQILSVRLPSLDEVLNFAQGEQKKIEKDLQEVFKETQDVQKEMDELNRELLKQQNKRELSWKEKKKAEEILKRQAEIRDKLGNIENRLENMNKSLQENNAISPETLQKYQELQRLMQEINNPDFRRMQEQMKEAMQNMSPDQMQKAMENFKFDEEQFKKSIERTMKILERMKAEQTADALSKRAEELRKRQEELEKQAENANPSDKAKRDELAAKQEKLEQDMQKLAEDMKALEELMKKIGNDMPMDALEKAEQALNKEQTSGEMKEAQQKLQQGDFNQAMQNQQNASKNLQNFASEMQKMMEQMNNNVTKEALRKMQKAVNDMLELSKKQEALKSRTKNMEYNSTQFPELSKKQSEIREGLNSVANSMMELSEKSFAVTPEMGKDIGNAMNQMTQSFQELADRRTSGASQMQQNAMSSMNSAIQQMQTMVSAMKQSGNGSCPNPGGMGQGQGQGQPKPGGMSFSERLQQAAALQQKINQGLSQQMGGTGGRMSPEQQAELGRLAGEQGKATKSVQELAREQKELAGDKKALGDLGKVANDMKEVLHDIKTNNITPETMKRQDRILSRLLDATKSIHDRDFEKKREAKTGKERFRNSPPALDLSTQEGRNKAYRDLLRSLSQGYTKDYEQLIRKYFEAMKKNGELSDSPN